MVKINLLTPELGGLKREPFSWKGLKIAAILMLIAFFIISAGSGAIFFQTYLGKRRLISMIRHQEEAQDIAGQIKDLKQRKDDLKREIDMLAGYDKTQNRWSKRLLELGRVIPPQVWLTQLDFTSYDTSVETDSLFLKGGLFSEEKGNPLKTLSSFIKRIQNNRLLAASFHKPVLSDFHSEMKNDSRIMAFSLELPYKNK